MTYKTKAYVGPRAEQNAERDGHWLKAHCGRAGSIDWCIDHGVPVNTKASNEGAGPTGAFVTPQSFQNAIIRVVEDQASFAYAEQRTSTSDENIRPRRTGGLTANWCAEGASIPESSFTLDAIDATAKKLGLLVRLSNEVEDDAAPDLAEFLATEFGFAIAGAIDDAGWNGTATSTYGNQLGIFTRLQTGTMKGAVAAASGHKTFLTVDSSDIANLMASVNASALPNARWFMSSSCYANLICRLAGTSGQVVAANVNGKIEASYLGFPISFSSKLPTADATSDLSTKPMLAFGDLAQSSVVVTRRHLEIATSLQHAMDADQTLVRATTRVAVLNHSLGSATVRSPVAALIGTA